MPSAQAELFPSPQPDLFGDAAPAAPAYVVPYPIAVNTLRRTLEMLQAAEVWPWDADMKAARMERNVPKMLAVLPALLEGAMSRAALSGAVLGLVALYLAFWIGVTLLVGRLRWSSVTNAATLAGLWLLLTRTRVGLVIQSALTHPEMVEALGHNVPRVFMLVFGAGCALAGLAGVIGGSTFLTEPAMAATVGSIIFVVVVVGGMGSLAGAFIASLLIGVIQTFAVAFDWSLGSAAARMGIALAPAVQDNSLIKLTISQVAPILPYLFLVLILIFRPKGLLGSREG